jgi:hypothetical protein
MSTTSEPSEAFKKGIRIRREVLGDTYVDKALAGVSDNPLVAFAENSRVTFMRHCRMDSYLTGLRSICETRTGVCDGSVLG